MVSKQQKQLLDLDINGIALHNLPAFLWGDPGSKSFRSWARLGSFEGIHVLHRVSHVSSHQLTFRVEPECGALVVRGFEWHVLASIQAWYGTGVESDECHSECFHKNSSGADRCDSSKDVQWKRSTQILGKLLCNMILRLLGVWTLFFLNTDPVIGFCGTFLRWDSRCRLVRTQLEVRLAPPSRYTRAAPTWSSDKRLSVDRVFLLEGIDLKDAGETVTYFSILRRTDGKWLACHDFFKCLDLSWPVRCQVESWLWSAGEACEGAAAMPVAGYWIGGTNRPTSTKNCWPLEFFPKFLSPLSNVSMWLGVPLLRTFHPPSFLVALCFPAPFPPMS